jgi:hypothetical protein
MSSRCVHWCFLSLHYAPTQRNPVENVEMLFNKSWLSVSRAP